MAPLSPIHVAPGGRYFETSDNEPFLFIGANDSITWPGLAGLFRRRDPAAVDAYLARLAANGATVLRLMLEYAHSDGRYFERPVGRFNPLMVRLWDDLFARCEAHGLRVLLAPWDNFWMALAPAPVQPGQRRPGGRPRVVLHRRGDDSGHGTAAGVRRAALGRERRAGRVGPVQRDSPPLGRHARAAGRGHRAPVRDCAPGRDPGLGRDAPPDGFHFRPGAAPPSTRT